MGTKNTDFVLKLSLFISETTDFHATMPVTLLFTIYAILHFSDA